MKDALLILPRFLLRLMVLLLVFSLFTLLSAASLGNWAAERIPRIAETALLPSIIGALFLSFMYAPERGGPRLLAIVLLTALSGAVLFFGLILSNELCVVCQDDEIEFPFRSGEIVPIRTGALFTAATYAENGRIDGIVEFTYRQHEPALIEINPASPLDVAYYASARYDSRTNRLETNKTPIRILPEDPIVSPLIDPPDFLARFIGEVRGVGTYLMKLRDSAIIPYLLLCIGLCGFAASCIFFSRMSQWRLISLLIIILMYRGIFLVFDLFTGELILDLFSQVDHPVISAHLPSLLLLTFAVLFVAMDQLFHGRSRTE